MTTTTKKMMLMISLDFVDIRRYESVFFRHGVHFSVILHRTGHAVSHKPKGLLTQEEAQKVSC